MREPADLDPHPVHPREALTPRGLLDDRERVLGKRELVHLPSVPDTLAAALEPGTLPFAGPADR